VPWCTFFTMRSPIAAGWSGERVFVVLILMFFSLLFWAFFEQAGSSLNNFTDRNVDRVLGGHRIAPPTSVPCRVRVLSRTVMRGSLSFLR